jgi:hypothetical protein
MLRKWLVRALRRIEDWLAPVDRSPLTALSLPAGPGEQTRLAQRLVAEYESSRRTALEMIAAERACRPQTPDQIEHAAQRERFANKPKRSPKWAERF